MGLREDVGAVKAVLEGVSWDNPAHEAMYRIEKALNLPKTATRGFYQYSKSGLYYADGEGHWFDVTDQYKPTSYPDMLKTEELIRLVREDEND